MKKILNEKKSKTLEQAKKLNETAKHRCVALCIETRPDFASTKEGDLILDPFCNGSAIGIETSLLNRKYLGIMLSNKSLLSIYVQTEPYVSKDMKLQSQSKKKFGQSKTVIYPWN